MRPSRRGLFGGALAALGAALWSRPARAAAERHLVVYFVKGGWDPSFVFDPHFGSSVVAGDESAELATVAGIPFADSPARPSVRRFFEAWGAQTAVVNGLYVGSISHDAGTRLLFTGRGDAAGADLCTRIAAGAGASLALPHVVVGGPSFPGDDGALVSFFDDTSLAAARGTGPVPRDEAREARLQAWLQAEAQALPVGDIQADAWRASLGRLPALQDFAATAPSDVGLESGRVELIASLLGRGLSRTAVLTGTIPPLAQWDSHIRNAEMQSVCYENLFARLDELCAVLQGTVGADGGSLLARTRILVVSEMGRQPSLNAQGGKDHWATTSAMLIGADVAGGRVLGATGDGLVARGLDRASGAADDGAAVFDPGALAATLALGFDLDPEELAPGSEPLAAIWE
ncbi:MAG: DUF1501 domain-containing protein [Myxococcales bacterium]|nr:DUF1501 domain-containing protein [Myxococcales bacterium]